MADDEILHPPPSKRIFLGRECKERYRHLAPQENMFDSVAPEIVANILDALDPPSFLAARLTCIFFKDTIGVRQLWSRKKQDEGKMGDPISGDLMHECNGWRNFWPGDEHVDFVKARAPPRHWDGISLCPWMTSVHAAQIVSLNLVFGRVHAAHSPSLLPGHSELSPFASNKQRFSAACITLPDDIGLLVNLERLWVRSSPSLLPRLEDAGLQHLVLLGIDASYDTDFAMMSCDYAINTVKTLQLTGTAKVHHELLSFLWRVFPSTTNLVIGGSHARPFTSSFFQTGRAFVSSITSLSLGSSSQICIRGLVLVIQEMTRLNRLSIVVSQVTKIPISVDILVLYSFIMEAFSISATSPSVVPLYPISVNMPRLEKLSHRGFRLGLLPGTAPSVIFHDPPPDV